MMNIPSFPFMLATSPCSDRIPKAMRAAVHFYI